MAAITTARTCLVVADVVQRGMQAGDHAFRQAVARGGAIERQYRDTADGFAQQIGGCGAGARAVWADMAKRFHYRCIW